MILQAFYTNGKTEIFSDNPVMTHTSNGVSIKEPNKTEKLLNYTNLLDVRYDSDYQGDGDYDVIIETLDKIVRLDGIGSVSYGALHLLVEDKNYKLVAIFRADQIVSYQYVIR